MSENPATPQTFQVGHPGHSELHLQASPIEGASQHHWKLTAIGPLELLELVAQWRQKVESCRDLRQVPLPQGHSPAELLLKELLLKARGEWKLPYTEEELCHCRAVATQKVLEAIAQGAHTPEKVSRWTSASTSCGSCRKDVTSLLDYYLNKPSPHAVSE